MAKITKNENGQLQIEDGINRVQRTQIQKAINDVISEIFSEESVHAADYMSNAEISLAAEKIQMSIKEGKVAESDIVKDTLLLGNKIVHERLDDSEARQMFRRGYELITLLTDPDATTHVIN
jgi:hypothetical protein